MIIGYCTINGIKYQAFSDECAAAEWIVERVGPDYAERLWIDRDGNLVRADASLDFAAEIYISPSDAVDGSIAGLDPYAMPTAMRALADAIEAGSQAGIE